MATEIHALVSVSCMQQALHRELTMKRVRSSSYTITLKDWDAYEDEEILALDAHNHYSEERWHQMLWQSGKPLCWLGLEVFEWKSALCVAVYEIQGIKSVTHQIPLWHEAMLRILIHCCSAEVKQIWVKPAQCQLHWHRPYIPDLHGEERRRTVAQLHQRMAYYYNEIPKRLGFSLASKRAISRFVRYNVKKRNEIKGEPGVMPFHTLVLNDLREA